MERLAFTWGAYDEKTEMAFQLALPEHLSEEQVREWLATGMREGWSQTLDRLGDVRTGVAARN